MKYGIIKVKRAFLYEENGVDVVDEVFFGWSVMWEDEGEWIEVWTHYGYRGWMERNLIEEKSREWMEGREKAGNTYVVTRGFADVMRGARVQARMLETLGRGCFVEKMEETENGYCRVKLANGISGFVPEVALRKRLDSDRFLWGKSEERFFVEQGIPEGLYITPVDADSPAMAAGLQSGDVITEIDGEAVISVDGYQTKLLSLTPGDVANVTIQRQGNDGYTEIKCPVTVSVLQ